MVDFERLNEIQRKRQRAFEAWIRGSWPNGDWNRLSARERELIDMAFRRGYGQGHAEGYSNGLEDSGRG